MTGAPRGLLAVLGVALALWLAVTMPLALGQRTLYFRDVFTIHLPLKAFGAEQLAEGRIPALDPTRGLGQPFRGNPQAAAFYPGNLLYPALPFWSAFNLHYALHWLLALVAMMALARELEIGWAGATIAGLAYAGSGWTLSALTFHHVVVATAWWPLALWGVVRGGRRGLAWGGVACGMALLGGAWVVVGLGAVPLLLAAIARSPAGEVSGAGETEAGGVGGLGRRLLRGGVAAATVLVVGALVALPQIVATLRVLPFTFRGTAGVPLAQVALYSLHPLRWLEFVLPLPWGWPADLGVLGYWSAVTPRVPLVLSLYCGLVALVLALVAVRRHAAWALLAAAGLALAWVGGAWPAALSALSGGLFRYPEKTLLWTALALPLLAGWGADRVLSEVRPRSRLRVALLTAAGVVLTAGAAAWLLRRPLAGRLAEVLAPPRGAAPAAQVELHVVLAAASLLLASLWLVGTAWAVRRRSGTALAALQLAALVQLAPLVMTADAAPFRRAPEWAAHLPPGTAVVSAPQDGPFADPAPPYRLADRSVVRRLALGAADLAPVPGVLHGWTYPLAPDADGLVSPLTSALLYHLPQLDPPGRAAWLRAVGTEALVIAGDPAAVGLASGGLAGGVERVAAADRAGVPTALYRLLDSAPPVRWPARLEGAASPQDAFLRVARRPAGGEAVVAAGTGGSPPAHRSGGAVRVLEVSPDRWRIEVASGGGVAVLRRAYQRLWTAWTVPGEGVSTAGSGRLRPGGPAAAERALIERQRLPTLAADLMLLAVEVPPGLHRIEVAVSSWPEAIAAAVAVPALLAALALALLPARVLRRKEAG